MLPIAIRSISVIWLVCCNDILTSASISHSLPGVNKVVGK